MIGIYVSKVGGHLVLMEGGRVIYQPPDFIKHTSRIPLQALARKVALRGCVDIADIMEYESAQPRKSHGY